MITKYKRVVIVGKRTPKPYMSYLSLQVVTNERIIMRHGASKQCKLPDDWFKRMLESAK